VYPTAKEILKDSSFHQVCAGSKKNSLCYPLVMRMGIHHDNKTLDVSGLKVIHHVTFWVALMQLRQAKPGPVI